MKLPAAPNKPNELNKPTNSKNPVDASNPTIELSGQVERVTFSEAENGFAVIRLRIPGESDPVTVVGHLMAVAPGLTIRLKGQWTDHPRFGRQFKAEWAQPEIPATPQGLQTYLGSGLIRGIGPQLAGRIVDRFGMQAVDIFDHHQERLLQINGIGPTKLAEIKKSWDIHNGTRQIMLFLQSHGISPALAAKILKTYGFNSISKVKDSPFQLAEDIPGVGFLTADRIADRVGFSADHPQRIQAGILHVLNQQSDEGHVFYPLPELSVRVKNMLGVGDALITAAVSNLVRAKKITIQNLADFRTTQGDALQAVYLMSLYFFETYIARALSLIARAPLPHPGVEMQPVLSRVQQQLQITLAAEQTRAVRMALSEKTLVITGGPGTGKTTIIRAITRVFEHLGSRILLAAPTGRAAKRMSETTARAAKTIHRLLEFSPMAGGFQRHDERPLDCELLIIDEASMVDTQLMYHLLKAVPAAATVIFVGDDHQLPSVGPGNVLHDIIASRVVPVVTLTEIFRQAAAGRIIKNAHRINAGHLPEIEAPQHSVEDFYFIRQSNPEEILDTILKVTAERIPRRFGLDPVEDIQVLTPMHKGLVGAANLNQRLQALLNPGDAFIKRGDQYLRLHDKVMQVRNNYQKEVFNGDIGRVVAVNASSARLTIRFDDRLVHYEYAELEDIVLAYAISVHKSQGSEYAAVVIPVTTQHYVMLQRNLLYTAVTRAKRLVVLVGDQRALAIAVKNNHPQQRYTYLSQRLAGQRTDKPLMQI